jgi:hypothetical protein
MALTRVYGTHDPKPANPQARRSFGFHDQGTALAQTDLMEVRCNQTTMLKEAARGQTTFSQDFTVSDSEKRLFYARKFD